MLVSLRDRESSREMIFHNPAPACRDRERSSSNHDLAKLVVSTEGKQPEKTRDEILAEIEHAPNPAEQDPPHDSG